MNAITISPVLDLVLIDGSGSVAALSSQELALFAGDTVRISGRVRKQDGTAPLLSDLTGSAFFFALTRVGGISPLVSREDTTADRTTDGDGYPLVFFDLVTADTFALANPATYRCGVRIKDADGNNEHLILASNVQLLETNGRDTDTVTAPAAQTPLGAGPSGTAAETVTADEAIDQFATLKSAGASTERYAMLDVGDDVSLFLGSAAAAASAQGSSFTAQFVMGPRVTLLSDGTAIIPAGATFSRSTTVKGRVVASAENPIGVNVGDDVAATLDAQVTARCRTF